MKYHLISSAFLLFILTACGQVSEAPASRTEVATDTSASVDSTFDAELARRLGADDYGMKTYVMAFLKAGPNRDQDSTTAARLQRAHLDNIQRLAEAGKLILAGPFMDQGEMRGIYVFNTESVEEARALTASDPAIEAGRLQMELHPWYGSAALQQVNEIHEHIAKVSY